MRLCLLACLLLSTVATAQTSGRHFLRQSRLPATPAASATAEAAAQPARAPAPLAKLRSGRAWPRYAFSRLPQEHGAVGQGQPTGQPVDAAAKRHPSQRRGFWRARG